MLNLTNALAVEWKQAPTALFQHLVEGLPRRVKFVILKQQRGDQLHINVHDFGMRCLTNRCPHTVGHVVYIHVEDANEKHAYDQHI
jgi:hypothetical protein